MPTPESKKFICKVLSIISASKTILSSSELDNLKYIEDTIKHLAFLYGYSEIRTPIFEHTEVFIRSVGQSSDIVTKEIYNFKDKGGRDITLRPEGTAGVIRAINENKLLQKQN